MNDVTQALDAIANGDPTAIEQLFPLVYEDLRRVASGMLVQEKPGQTLQATALVHEAFIRLVGSGAEQKWDHRGHFFAAAATAMRRILVDHAMRKKTLKRGGHLVKVDFQLGGIPEPQSEEEVLHINEALEKLAQDHERKVKLIELWYFAGLTMEQCADVLGVSLRTVERDWAFARAWLRRELSREDS